MLAVAPKDVLVATARFACPWDGSIGIPHARTKNYITVKSKKYNAESEVNANMQDRKSFGMRPSGQKQ